PGMPASDTSPGSPSTVIPGIPATPPVPYPCPYCEPQSRVCSVSAAKRRKNAAHGASHGLPMETWRAPEWRKKLQLSITDKINDQHEKETPMGLPKMSAR